MNMHVAHKRWRLVCLAVLSFLILLQPGRAIAGLHAVLPPSPAASPRDGGEKTGVKRWAVKKATRALAAGIRAGGRILNQLIGYMDDKAAQIFRKYSDRIADELESIANIPDITVKIVREKIFYFLSGPLNVGHGNALVIANAIEGVLWILL